MVILNCTLKQKEIIDYIEDYKIDGENIFTFVKREKKVQLYFNSTIKDEMEEYTLLNKLMKSYKYAPALMINIVPCCDGKIKWF